ncbi:MAG: hypothetical protein KBC21_01380 [Candidatus Pacebacteria bacterium]|jgi:uncharacterized membrane protein|nr:hypothetical protein [Candidatus Paceibacterota bacterium]
MPKTTERHAGANHTSRPAQIIGSQINNVSPTSGDAKAVIVVKPHRDGASAHGKDRHDTSMQLARHKVGKLEMADPKQLHAHYAMSRGQQGAARLGC